MRNKYPQADQLLLFCVLTNKGVNVTVRSMGVSSYHFPKIDINQESTCGYFTKILPPTTKIQQFGRKLENFVEYSLNQFPSEFS